MKKRFAGSIVLRLIEIVIHPESIVHSMVVYRDSAVMAQLGLPDMKVPIEAMTAKIIATFIEASKIDISCVRMRKETKN